MSLEELFEDAESRELGQSTELGRNKGREIDQIPLCGPCVEEVSRESTEDDCLIPMALRRVDRYDGGLSRRRWEEATSQSTHEGYAHATPSRARPHSKRQNGTFVDSTGSRGQHILRTPSPIYVSMHDPVGEPAFRRSATKPIPRWMQYLPSKRSEESDSIERPSSVLDHHFSPPDSSVAESDLESGVTQSPSPPQVPAHMAPVRSVRSAIPRENKEKSTSTEEIAIPKRAISSQRASSDVSDPVRPGPAFKAIQMSRPFTFIDENPGQRPSSRLQPDCLSSSRHVRFTSPPKATSSPTIPSSSVSHTQSPSESSEYLDCHVPQASQGGSSLLLPSSLRNGSLSVTTPFVKRYAGGAAGPSAKTFPRSLGDQSCSTGLASGSKDFAGVGLGKMHTKHYEHAAQRKLYGGGDGAIDSGGDRRSGPAVTFQDQLKRMFGFS